MIRTAPAPVRGMVPSAYVRLLHRYLERQGLDAVATLGPLQPGERCPVGEWRTLLERASRRLRDPLLGLHLAGAFSLAELGLTGYVLQACADVAAALERFERYQRLLYDVNPMRRRLDGDALVLEWGVEAGRPGPLVDEFAIAAFVHFLRELTARPVAPQAVHFVNPAPADPKPYRAFFGCPVQFGRPATILRFPAGVLALPLRKPDPLLASVLQQQADGLLAALPADQDIVRDVRRCIAGLARDGRLRLAQVARELAMSPRTLHRRLELAGCSFRALREDTLRQLADAYLRDPQLPLAELSQWLGYSEQSAFSRAYRRWTGRTPQAARRLSSNRPR